MGMFDPKMGTWWIRSKTDSRWNTSGRAYVGGFMKPREVDEAIKNRKKILKEKLPDDLEWGYMKD